MRSYLVELGISISRISKDSSLPPLFHGMNSHQRCRMRLADRETSFCMYCRERMSWAMKMLQSLMSAPALWW